MYCIYIYTIPNLRRRAPPPDSLIDLARGGGGAAIKWSSPRLSLYYCRAFLFCTVTVPVVKCSVANLSHAAMSSANASARLCCEESLGFSRPVNWTELNIQLLYSYFAVLPCRLVIEGKPLTCYATSSFATCTIWVSDPAISSARRTTCRAPTPRRYRERPVMFAFNHSLLLCSFIIKLLLLVLYVRVQYSTIHYVCAAYNFRWRKINSPTQIIVNQLTNGVVLLRTATSTDCSTFCSNNSPSSTSWMQCCTSDYCNNLPIPANLTSTAALESCYLGTSVAECISMPPIARSVPVEAEHCHRSPNPYHWITRSQSRSNPQNSDHNTPNTYFNESDLVTLFVLLYFGFAARSATPACNPVLVRSLVLTYCTVSYTTVFLYLKLTLCTVPYSIIHCCPSCSYSVYYSNMSWLMLAYSSEYFISDADTSVQPNCTIAGLAPATTPSTSAATPTAQSNI